MNIKLKLYIVTLIVLAACLVSSPAFAAAETAPPDKTPWWAIAGIVALAFSEIVALVPRWKSNSVITWILNLVKAVFGPKE